jgi:quinoprotein glucose dehydrogenase
MGLWRPIPSRDAAPAVEALKPKIDQLFSRSSESLRNKAIGTVRSLGIKEAAPRLITMVIDRETADDTRAEALETLFSLREPGVLGLARSTLKSGGTKARIQAMRILVSLDPAAALRAINQTLEAGTAGEKQGVLAILAESPDQGADTLLLDWMDRLRSGKVPAEIQLDLITAAGRKESPAVRDKLADFEASRPRNDPLAQYRETLSGGDFRRGLAVFLSKAEVACIRCHKVSGPDRQSYGGDVGPDMSGIGSRQNREYLLESIVTPDHKIAQGFETVVLGTSDGKVVTGVLRGEDDKEVRLITAEGHPLTIPKREIEERKRGPSAMPADLVTKLTKAEIRDLVEFLTNLKAK